ncbi:MAG: type IV secretory system conjugative DNA transfer family protein [Clostridiales bacterium]|nr:type IV secretory system conjugative DNA transfer family protein [Clostridiales bacterium]
MDKMILGEKAAFSTDCNETGLNNNVFVCGGSGCGKTLSITEPRLLETKQSSLIVTVTKRRIVHKYKPVFEQRGYKVEDLNYVNPLESSVAYDPLQYVASYSDIRFLSESIVMANPRKEKSTGADPYWDEAAISLCCAEIAYVLMTDENATLADVLAFHDRISFWDENGQIATSVDKKFDRLEDRDPTCYAVSCWKSFHQLPIRTAGCVFGALNTTIDTIFSPELREMIATKRQVDFEKLATEKTVLFVSTSAVNPALNCFINMFYAQAFKSLFEYAESRPAGWLPIPVHVLCDDFATGSRILNFPEYISIFREKRISVTLLVQSESQLESMYGPNDATTIINNCDTYLYMGGMDLKTGKSISERLNVPLDEVLYMPIGREYIFRRGQKPVATRRYDIMRNELYLKITEEYESKIRKSER